MTPAFLLTLVNQVTDPTIVIHKPTGIRIVCKNEPDMFPQSWMTEEIDAKSVPLDASEVARSQKAVIQALDCYPAKALKSLKVIYVSKEISFYGLGYGGTNSLDTVYITNDGPSKGYTDDYIRSTVHHEYSSILLRNFSSYLDQAAWTKTLPPSFTYRQGGTESVRTGTASTRYNPDFMKDGFLAQYATSSQEEDFNMTAEGLFSANPKFWAAVDQYPLLKGKVQIVVNFYKKLDPAFTETFFRTIVRPTTDSNQPKSL